MLFTLSLDTKNIVDEWKEVCCCTDIFFRLNRTVVFICGAELFNTCGE